MKDSVEQDKSKKNDKTTNRKKKAITIIAISAIIIILSSILISMIGAVAAPFSAISDVIDKFSDNDETSLTDNEKELIDESYRDYLCDDEDDNCSKRYNSYIESQKDFMDRFKTISKEYNLTKKQQKILYQTIVFGYSIDEIMPGDTYNIDTTSDSDTENVYEKEKDTIKRLAKLFNGSEQNYYNNLIMEDDFFDDRKSCQSYYIDYASDNNLNYNNVDSWSPEDKQNVRKKIVKEIQSLVSGYLDDGKKPAVEIHTLANNTYYWWPIGPSSVSKMLEKNQNFTYYYEEPLYKGISDGFGFRIHPLRHVPALHNGIDIPAVINTAVIASQSGVVTEVNNTCATSNSRSCGFTHGNYIEMETDQGYIIRYEHLAKETIMVKKGDKIKQGQLIAGVGSSGDVTGPHLHFTIKINGQAVNPLDYVDPNNPRPKSSGRLNYNYSVYSPTEFSTLLKNYYSRETVCNSSSQQHVNGCNSFKDEILYKDGANVIYEVASSYNINPELVVIRSMVEGYSPGTYYNYFGFACYNTASIDSCTKFSNFRSSMNSFFKNLSQYTSLENMSENYAYLGDYWYTQRNWGLGGCIYAEYIYPDGVPERVKEICSYPEDYCTKYNTEKCVKTTDEDKAAFTAFQVGKMEEVAEKVFG